MQRADAISKRKIKTYHETTKALEELEELFGRYSVPEDHEEKQDRLVDLHTQRETMSMNQIATTVRQRVSISGINTLHEELDLDDFKLKIASKEVAKFGNERWKNSTGLWHKIMEDEINQLESSLKIRVNKMEVKTE